MSDPAVLVERDGHVLTITLNRPDKRNAFNAEVLCRLGDAWDLLDGDPELRVAIMTGAGGNFSAGADLDRLVGALTSGKPAEKSSRSGSARTSPSSTRASSRTTT